MNIAETLFHRSLEAERDLMAAISEYERTMGTYEADDAYLRLDAARSANFNVSVMLLASEIRAGFATWAPDDSRSIGTQAFADALKVIAANIEEAQAAEVSYPCVRTTQDSSLRGQI